MDLKKAALKYALQNAAGFGGRANAGAVIGKILSEDPKLKSNVREVAAAAAAAVKEVNKMSVEQQVEKLKALAPELLEKKKAEKRELAELKNAVFGKVVTRIPPEPSKYAHIGHALSFMINYLYAKKYGGKCIVRFEDTNPELTKQEYVNAILDDISYLGIKPCLVSYVSDDMAKLYSYAEKLISSSNAYICLCEVKQVRDMRHKGEKCGHCASSADENMKLWKKMLNREFRSGEAVLRLRGNMKDKNDVMRDPVIFRITYERHYRHGAEYCVWPLYDFENSVEDGMQGVTHILRSIEFGGMRVELQNRLKDLLKLPRQTVIQYGRFNVIDAISKGREIRKLINEGKVSGWDDPRLVTIKSLRRRGIQLKAFEELAVEVGLSVTPTNLGWDLISSVNRRLLDRAASRYFFVDNPKEISVENAPEREVALKLHPDMEAASRKFNVGRSFYVSEKDYEAIKSDKSGKLIRLMDCLNFRKSGKKLVFDSLEIEKYRENGSMIIHWLPVSNDAVRAEVLMPDALSAYGLAEAPVSKIKVGDIIQFVRFGFCRLEGREGSTLKFIYCHN